MNTPLQTTTVTAAALLSLALSAGAPVAAQPTTANASISTAVPIVRTAAQRRQRGPTTRRARLIATPGEYRGFFDPQGSWSLDRQPFYTGGERVLAFAPGEGQGTPTIVHVRQAGGTLLLRVAYHDQGLNREQRARPFHAVVIRTADLTGPVTKVVASPFFLEPEVPGTGGGVRPLPTPKPTVKIDQALGSSESTAPARRRSIVIRRTVARWRADQRGQGLGAATPRAGLATTPGEYRALFYPRGQWAVRGPVAYASGERVVVVAAGQAQVELSIVRLIQRGAILTAVVERRAVPNTTRARAFHAVAIQASDLTGPVRRVVAVEVRTPAGGTAIPIRGDVAKPTRYRGPSRRRAGLASRPAEYKALFFPQGSWRVDAQPRYADGERAVVVAGGEGSHQLQIVALRQRGSTLVADVQMQQLPPSVLARPFHAVKILASDLRGPVRRVTVRIVDGPRATTKTAGLTGGLGD